jgi:hypothetical protein
VIEVLGSPSAVLRDRQGTDRDPRTVDGRRQAYCVGRHLRGQIGIIVGVRRFPTREPKDGGESSGTKQPVGYDNPKES